MYNAEMNIVNPEISATELARNLASIIDQVRITRTRMTITKGNQAIAQITPIVSSEATLADLSQLLKASRLSRAQKQSFRDDLEKIASAAELPASAWE